jgi:surface antigen
VRPVCFGLGTMPVTRLTALVLLAVSIGGCAAATGPKAADGAALSGFLGKRIGAALDDEDRRRAYAAQLRALESGPSGAPVAWRNPDSGHYGNIVPGPAYDLNGAPCREYTHTVFIDGQLRTQRGTACRNPDDTWSVIS